MTDKRIAIRIDKEIWQEFKRILKVVYNVNHNHQFQKLLNLFYILLFFLPKLQIFYILKNL